MTKVFLVEFDVGGETYAKVCHWRPDGGDPVQFQQALIEFFIHLYQNYDKPRFTSPTILAARWVVWSSGYDHPHSAMSTEDIGVVSNERYVFADYVFTVQCQQPGGILGMPDVRCTQKNHNGGPDKPIYMQPFRETLRQLEEEVTEPVEHSQPWGSPVTYNLHT